MAFAFNLLGRIQLVEAYQAQTKRAQMALKLLEEQVKLRALQINNTLISQGYAQKVLAAHGVPARVIATCGYLPQTYGIVVKFNESGGGKRRPGQHRPFTPVEKPATMEARKAARLLAKSMAAATVDRPT